jgi:hypothetical protein
MDRQPGAPAMMIRETLLCLSLVVLIASACPALELFEDFDKPGNPNDRHEVTWSYTDQMLPVKSWDEFIPGDGYAHITFDAVRENDRDIERERWPFQMIFFESVGPGHRLEMRAKNTVISGVGSFIFTYTEKGGGVDEIDIEIVGNDTHVEPKEHPTGVDDGGWTDARFNTWELADRRTLQPAISHKQPVVDADGKKISLDDGKFHIYTIDWAPERVDFAIDGVHQQTITGVVPKTPSALLVGVRHMSWTGALDWKGTRTMLVDWIRVKPLERD